jgi:hypothetical protein
MKIIQDYDSVLKESGRCYNLCIWNHLWFLLNIFYKLSQETNYETYFSIILKNMIR